jgi:hypothetical protein
MPLTILVAARPAQRRFVDTPSRVEAWQLLHREADRAYPQLRTLWQTVFADYRADLDTDAMRAALRSGNLLDVERLIAPAWRAVSDAVRLPLQLLLRETASRSAEAVLPATEATLGADIAVQFGVVVPEALTAIETYAGTQIVGIGETTLKSVRAVIRSGFEEGRSMTQMMRDLEAFVGLTPRQTEALETLRQRLLDAGKTRAQAQQAVDRAARRALQLRVEQISRTESLFAANAGQQALWTEAARQGTLDPERFRRRWILTPDDRLCLSICAPVPSQNPQGVGLHEPFQTPIGPVMFPPAHPQCRCAVSLVAREGA